MREADVRREAGRAGEPPAAPSTAGKQQVVLGLLAAPGVAHELAGELARKLPGLLGQRFPGVSWKIEVRVEPMAAASGDDVDLVEVAHQRLLAEGWQLAVCLTDFPIHIGNRPVTAYASATHGVGLLSVPAFGAVNLDERVQRAVLRLIEGLVGESVEDHDGARDRQRNARMRRRLEELASPLGRAERQDDRAVRFVTAVWRGNLRLLIGMVRANRPWRLITGLSRALVGALGLDIFGVASPGVWLLADGASWWRLLVVGAGSIAVICVSLVAAHGLWERTDSPKPEARERAVLFNLATALTVAIGVVTLYLALFAINVASAAVVVSPEVLGRQLGHTAGVADYLALAWLVASLATLGGALGASLEHDRAVRQAAYGRRPDVRTEGP
jgi:uncharacterized membrane protein